MQALQTNGENAFRKVSRTGRTPVYAHTQELPRTEDEEAKKCGKHMHALQTKEGNAVRLFYFPEQREA